MNKRGENKGQVTIFIIMAILIVGVVALYFTIFKGSEQAKVIPTGSESVYQKVQECLKLTSEEAIIYVGQHGGYYDAPDSRALDYFGKKIPYYYQNNQTSIPEKEHIELELNNYTNDKIENCLNFENFIAQGINISSKTPKIVASIKNNSIGFKMNYSLVVSKEDKTERFEEFSEVIPSNMIALLYSSKEIVDNYSREPGVLCASCLNEISIKDNINIKSNFFENNTIFVVYSNKEENSTNKLKWVFVVRK